MYFAHVVRTNNSTITQKIHPPNTGKKLLITTVVKVQNCGEIKVKTMPITSRCQGFFLSPSSSEGTKLW